MKKSMGVLIIIFGGLSLAACGTTEKPVKETGASSTMTMVSKSSETTIATATSETTTKTTETNGATASWTENKALEFLKNTMSQTDNSSYSLDDWSVYDGRGEWSILKNEAESIAVHWQYTNGGGMTYQLTNTDNGVELLVFGGAFYPDRPDDKYLISPSDYRIIEYTNLLLETAESSGSVENPSSADPIVAAMNTYYQQKNGDNKIYVRQNSKGYEKEMGEYGWIPLVFDFDGQSVLYEEAPWGGSTMVGWWKESNGEFEFNVDRF
ncbi:hypothetical protein [Enterococcus sp. AZ007]|uniref:hypothetical protein n=1 Tax=Enterococcus sp. AZ007 TaxID=2774839 RepID=UPI003F243F53